MLNENWFSVVEIKKKNTKIGFVLEPICLNYVGDIHLYVC